MSLRPGEKITAFSAMFLTAGRVTMIRGAHGFEWAPEGVDVSRVAMLDEEGITWMRGWHIEGSKDIQALRAAKKLYDSAERERTAPTISIGNGGIHSIPAGALVALTTSRAIAVRTTIERNYTPPNYFYDFDPTR